MNDTSNDMYCHFKIVEGSMGFSPEVVISICLTTPLFHPPHHLPTIYVVQNGNYNTLLKMVKVLHNIRTLKPTVPDPS